MRWSLLLSSVAWLPMGVHTLTGFSSASASELSSVTSSSAAASSSSADNSTSAAAINATHPFPTSEGINTTTLLMNGTLITDPVRLAYFEKLHAETVESLNNGTALSHPEVRAVARLIERGVPFNDAVTQARAQLLQRRQSPQEIAELIEDFVDMFLVLAATEVSGEFAKISTEIDKMFIGDDVVWWDSDEYCRVHYQTKGGANEEIESFARGTYNPTSLTGLNIGWNDPASTAPPIFFFDDPVLGPYSVQFTATDTVAWSGANYTEKCIVQGLCNPQYVFYHRGYRLVLDTWLTQGEVSSCQYTQGHDCKGLCSSGVINQFSTGGDVWGGDCAVPCYADLSDLTTVGDTTPRVMVVGDSISHGMQDDWTWRYRLWDWLTNRLGYGVALVGPYTGTHGTPGVESSEPMAPPLPGEEALNFQVTGGYNAAVTYTNFTNSGHGAYWGRQATQVVPEINAWVEQYQPDYILILLGFNDLGWFVQDPAGLIGQMGALIENAREAKADVNILVGNVVQRVRIDGRQDLIDNTLAYNALLAETLPNWFRWESPIALVDVASMYDCSPDNGCPDGYDGLHPTASGEFHIANAFADVLQSAFGFEGEPFADIIPDPVPSRDVLAPTNIKSYAYPEGVFTMWDNMVNNRGYEIRARITGNADWWSDGLVYPTTWGSWLSWVLPGQSWDTQVRTRSDFDETSDWSDIATVTAAPATAPGPSTIGVFPLIDDESGTVLVTWAAVEGNYDIHCYGVLAWDLDEPDSFIAAYATTGLSINVPGLTVGHRYGFWVATYINLPKGSVSDFAVTPGGVPAPANDAIVGFSSPAAPTDLTYDAIDATTIQLSWAGAADAAGYTLYMRSVNAPAGTAYEVIGTTTDTTLGVAFLFPGIWTYEFCVGAYNGNFQSSYGGSGCQTPTVCCGYESTENAVRRDNAGTDADASASAAAPTATPSIISVVPPSSNATTSNTTAQAVVLTSDPRAGQLYSLYTQALFSLQQNGTSLNLTFAAPDTVIRMF
ncbi:hypothetical protein SEUCBS139899_004183 [Sporothrix eucalyptigena]